MEIIYENGPGSVYPEDINPLSKDFTDVRSLALENIFSGDGIPPEINILTKDIVLILTTSLAEVPLEEIELDEKGRIKINSSLKEATIVKGLFINPEGKKGFMQILFVGGQIHGGQIHDGQIHNGQLHSEAYWKKTVGDSYELKQLITPQCEVINAHLLNPNSKRKSLQMPGTNMYIPFKRRIEF